MLNKNINGFSLLEVMVVAGILAASVLGMLNIFIYTSTGAELARNKTQVISEAQGKLDEIREYPFANIPTDYANGGSVGNTFTLSSVNGMGILYIDSSNPDLLTIDVVVSWEDKYGRIVGEDKDLDGVLDGGEDVNGNGLFDSPIELSTQIGAR